MVHRLPRKQIRITDLLLRTESEIADGVKHQHPVIAHIVILCPHRVYTTAADDRLVDLIVKFLYFIFHNLPHSIPFGTEWSIRQDFEIVNLYSLRDIKPICYNVRIVISMVFQLIGTHNHRLPGAVLASVFHLDFCK